MLSSDERELRKTQLGASDMHKLFNFDNKGAKDLWKEKLGLLESEDFTNKYLIAGNLLEEDCLRYYFEKNDIKNYTLNERVEHPTIKNFVVSTDGIIANEIPVENKTMNYESFSKLEKIPRNYLIQLHAQMSCLTSEHGIIVFNAVTDDDLKEPLLYEPSDIKQEVFTIEADKELIQEIESRAAYFLWCVEFKREPSERHYLRKQF